MSKTCRYKFLVIDNQDLLEINGLTRKVNQPIKHPEPVLKMDAPWNQDNERLCYTNIIYDHEEKLFKMWYCVEGNNDKEAVVWTGGAMKLAYATSLDGIGWQRPELGLVEINGSKKNNYILPEKCFYGATLIDDPSDIPARRYKMIFTTLGREVQWAKFHLPLSLAYSADGIHWDRPIHVNPVIRGISDCEFSLYYDPDRRKYQLYTRRVPNVPRDISLYESYDLVNWEDLGRVVVPDENDSPEMYNFYNMAPFRYEDYYLGMLNTQHTHPISEFYEGYYKSPGYPDNILGHVNIQLAFSRDGVNWSRPKDRSPLIANGEPGAPDFGGAYPSKYPVVINGETLIYYQASKCLHTWWHEQEWWGEDKKKIRDIVCLMLAKMPEDHWVSLDANSKEGSFICKPWGPPHEIFVNADAQDGSIEAELVTPYGKVVPDYSRADCVAIIANGKNQQINWKNGQYPWKAIGKDHLGGLLVKFYLKNAKLYSYTFTLPDPDGQLERNRLNARWCDHIKHRSDNWDRNSNEPAIGLPSYTGPEAKD